MDDRIKIFLWPDLPNGWVAAHASQVAQLGFNDFSEAQVSDFFALSVMPAAMALIGLWEQNYD